MNRNGIKAIACLSMLLDHVGFLLFPGAIWLRWCGRLAMPLFAYFIAEGCRHTRNRCLYLLRMVGLGLLCQVVYLAAGLWSGGVRECYLNILLTFSVSMVLCFAWLDLAEAYRSGVRRQILLRAAGFLGAVAGAVLLTRVCEGISLHTSVWIEFDYGLAGMLLPLFALIGENRLVRLLFFGLGVLLMCLNTCSLLPYVWYAFLAFPLLMVYNGRRGDPRWQPVFYAFYPVHLAAIYGIKMLVG